MDKNINNKNIDKSINSKTLKEYFYAEKEIQINIKIEDINRNNFKILLNNLEIKNINKKVDSKKNILSPYLKYFALLSVPAAMVMFGILFLNINKIQENKRNENLSQNNLAINNEMNNNLINQDLVQSKSMVKESVQSDSAVNASMVAVKSNSENYSELNNGIENAKAETLNAIYSMENLGDISYQDI